MLKLLNLTGLGARVNVGPAPTPPTTFARLPAYDPNAAPFVNNPYLVPGLTDPNDPESESDAWVQNSASPYFLEVGPADKRLRMVFNPNGGGTCHYAEINGVSCANFGFGAGFWNSATRDEAHQGWWNPTMGGWVRFHGPPVQMTISGDGKTVTTGKFIVAFFENQEYVFSRYNNLAPHDYPGAQAFLDPLFPGPHWSAKRYFDVGQNRDPAREDYRTGDEIDEDALGWDQNDEVQSETCAQMHATDFSTEMTLPAIRIRWLWAFERNPRGMHQFQVDPNLVGARFSGTVRDDAPDADDLSGVALNGGCRFNDVDDGSLSYLFFALSETDQWGNAKVRPMVDFGSEDTDRTFFYALMDQQDINYEQIAYSVTGERLHPKFDFDDNWIPNGTGGAGSVYLTTMIPGSPITAVAKGATTTITVQHYLPANGDFIVIARGRGAVPSMIQLEGNTYRVKNRNLGAMTCQLESWNGSAWVDLNSSGFTDYTSGLIFGSPQDTRALGIYHPRSPACRMPIEGYAAPGDPDPNPNRLRYRDNRRLQTSNKCWATGSEDRHGGQVYSTLRISGLYRRRNTGPYRNYIEVVYLDRILVRGHANEILTACLSRDVVEASMVDAVQPEPRVGSGS